MGEDAVVLEVLFLEAGEDIAFPIFVADVVRVAAAAAILGISSRCSVMLFEVWPVSVRLSIENMNHNQILFRGFAPSQSSRSCQAIKSSFIWSETLLRCWINLLKPEHALVHRSWKSSLLRELIKQLSFIRQCWILYRIVMVPVDDNSDFLMDLHCHQVLQRCPHPLDITGHRVGSINHKADLLALWKSSHRVRVFDFILSKLYIDLGILSFIVCKCLCSTSIMQQLHELNAIFRVSELTVIPHPVVMSIFELNPFFLWAILFSKILEIIESSIMALHQNTFLGLVSPHSSTHWEELVTILATSMRWVNSSLNHVIEGLLTVFVASWASLFASLWLLLKVYFQWQDDLLEIFIFERHIAVGQVFYQSIHESV